ncbi:hypothetical protein P3L10_020950 [Capsicum annuum]|uniref:uncharacterized protein LOC124885825 n=1 Tax=Capsicum annuum TaxID=4072 RepID=UPI001FB0EC0F|nr:uncharacterized protein LOC124885825 [Capsicum annuum]
MVVEIEDEDIYEKLNYWSTNLIGYVLGDSPYFKTMENYIAHGWNFISKPQVLYYDDGYYVFKFASAADRHLVMQSGPYMYRNRQMILRNWSLDFEFNPECLSKIPLWVKFPSLPLGYWSKKELSKLASVVGKLLYTDKCTAEIERISYARFLVEVDISHPLPEQVELNTPIGVLQQEIRNDWIPKFYVDCNVYGHTVKIVYIS